jgi:DNA-binding MarR family transcriptional regulator
MKCDRVKKFSIDYLRGRITKIKNKMNFTDLNEDVLIYTKISMEINKRIDDYVEKSMSKDGLVGSAWMVLIIIYSAENEQLYATEICDYLLKSKSTMSRVIESLEDKGYIVEITSKEDRRKTALMVTSNGKNYIEKKIKEHYGFYSHIYKNIDISRLMPEMEKILQNIYKFEEEN